MLQTITYKILFILLVFVGVESANAQYFEPQTNITGYIATEFNYFDELDGFDVNYGTSISEAGFLITYRPTEKMTLKSVFVYRPGYTFDQMLNEAYGEIYVTGNLNVKVGRFLLPLSPMNTYYYAPVNTSATLPILITNHEFFPLNIDGISINGKVGDDLKFKYEVFAGGYRNTTWLPSGAVGFFGGEVPYFKNQISSPYTIDGSYNDSYNVAAGISASVAYKTYFEFGASYFKPRKEEVPISVFIPENALFDGFPATQTVIEVGFERPTYGFNAKAQYGNTKVVSELWKGELEVDPLVFAFQGNAIPLTQGGDVDLEGSFVELSHRIEKFTPYVRYEDQLTDDIEYSRFTLGINYKPSFERTYKVEYMKYSHDSGDINGVVATLIYSF